MNGIYIDGNFTEFGDEFYPTNDLVNIDETGRLHIIGRLDDVIIGPNGENISPEEIESRIDKGAFEKASSLKGVFASIDQLTMSERPVKVLNLIGTMPENFKGIDRKALAEKLEKSQLFATECTRPTDEEVTRTRSAEYTEIIGKVCDVFAEILAKDRSES